MDAVHLGIREAVVDRTSRGLARFWTDLYRGGRRIVQAILRIFVYRLWGDEIALVFSQVNYASVCV
jgi:hypothetical protein